MLCVLPAEILQKKTWINLLGAVNNKATVSPAAAGETSVNAAAAVLSGLDDIFTLKEGQKTALKTFHGGHHPFTSN